MANQLTKDLEIMFEEYVEGFDAACVTSSIVSKFRPSDVSMQRGGDTVYRPQDYHMSVVEGLDITAQPDTSLLQRMIPASYKQPQNIRYRLDAKEMRDPEHKKQAGKAAGLRLAAQIEKDVNTVAANQAGVVVTQTGAFDWDLAATLEARMISRGVPMGVARKLVLNPFDYKDVAKELGARQYTPGIVQTAYEKAKIPDLASFDTYRADSLATIVGNAATGLTLGAEASFTPSAMTGDVPTDNRRMTITVSANTMKNGDAFTIEGVDEVHMIDKVSTGQRATFRVVSGGGTTSLVITPAIIASGPYQNVSAVGANGAAITLLNTTTAGANIAFADGALELMYGKLAFPQGQGAQVMTATSKNGANLIMSYEFDHLAGATTCRFTTIYGATVLQPEMVGLALAKQA